MNHHDVPGRIRLRVDTRSDAGPTAVVLHGWGEAPLDSETVGELLPGWSLQAPHHRGHGASDRVSGGVYHLADIIGDIGRVVSLLDESVLMVAFRRSAFAAVSAAALWPRRIRAVCLVEPEPPPVDTDPEPRRREWMTAALATAQPGEGGAAAPAGTDPLARFGPPEPVHPDDVEWVTRRLECPIGETAAPPAWQDVMPDATVSLERSGDTTADIAATARTLWDMTG